MDNHPDWDDGYLSGQKAMLEEAKRLVEQTGSYCVDNETWIIDSILKKLADLKVKL